VNVAHEFVSSLPGIVISAQPATVRKLESAASSAILSGLSPADVAGSSGEATESLRPFPGEYKYLIVLNEMA
jgi:hypothetical protein